MSNIHLTKLCLLLAIVFGLQARSFGQGRVVVNEFMAWPDSKCGATSDFIELLNFGPGPMNIGCYIVTNGQYAVTIPPNTILQPGQFYVLSGQNTLAKGCGNADSAITVDLNWTTCNCTDKPVPTTGDGFMKDGGSANEKVVLLDPNLNVVDAAVRDVTKASPSIPISTNTLSGGCTSKTFDLSTMGISYEDIGQSTGNANSFARRVDGDCGWVKTTAISGKAPNKTSSTSSASYQFNTVSASECASTAGKVSIEVSATNVASLFPMSYTLAYDKDSNNVFSDTDIYTYGVDNSAPSIDISNLAYGRYRITVASALGCNLKSYDFFIFNCYGVVLPLKLLSFNYAGVKENQQLFDCRFAGAENLKAIVLEASDGGLYQAISTLQGPFAASTNQLTIKAPLSTYSSFRLRMVDKHDAVSYSPVIKLTAQNAGTKFWPNPVSDRAFIQLKAATNAKVTYNIRNATGAVVAIGYFDLRAGLNTVSIAANNLQTGMYQLEVAAPSPAEQPVSFRFVKH